MEGEELDDCEVCNGLLNGINGNENRVHGDLVVCDYCSVAYDHLEDAEQMTKEQVVVTLRKRWRKRINVWFKAWCEQLINQK